MNSKPCRPSGLRKRSTSLTSYSEKKLEKKARLTYRGSSPSLRRNALLKSSPLYLNERIWNPRVVPLNKPLIIAKRTVCYLTLIYMNALSLNDGIGCFEEYGIIPGGKGTRTDLSQVVQAIQEGQSLRQIGETYPESTLKYGAGIMRLRMFHRPERAAPPEIWTFWGKTGTGKTRRVWEFADVDQLWVHPGDRWFDGYDSQSAVLFDDFDGSWFKLSYLLKLLDRYMMQVPVKGGYVWWNPKVIYLTSNIDPNEWYPQAHDQHRSALKRRLTEFGTIQKCE